MRSSPLHHRSASAPRSVQLARLLAYGLLALLVVVCHASAEDQFKPFTDSELPKNVKLDAGGKYVIQPTPEGTNVTIASQDKDSFTISFEYQEGYGFKIGDVNGSCSFSTVTFTEKRVVVNTDKKSPTKPKCSLLPSRAVQQAPSRVKRSSVFIWDLSFATFVGSSGPIGALTVFLDNRTYTVGEVGPPETTTVQTSPSPTTIHTTTSPFRWPTDEEIMLVVLPPWLPIWIFYAMVSATCFLLFLIILINIWRIYALVTKQRRRIAGQVGQIRVLEADKKMLAQPTKEYTVMPSRAQKPQKANVAADDEKSKKDQVTRMETEKTRESTAVPPVLRRTAVSGKK